MATTSPGGDPGENSQATAASTTADTASQAGSNNATIPTPPTRDESDDAVDWDVVDAGEYDRLTGLVRAARQGKPAEAAPATTTATATAAPTEGATAASTTSGAAATTAAATTTATVEGTPTTQPTTEGEGEDGTPKFGTKFRPRLGNLPEQAQRAIQLVREMADQGKPITLGEAETRIAALYGDPSAGGNGNGNAGSKPMSVSEIDAAITAKRGERKQAGLDADTQKIAELSDEIEGLIEKKNQTEQARRDAGRAANVETNKAKSEMRDLYPDFKDPNSGLAKEYTKVYQELEAEGSPILEQSQARQIRAITKLAAANLGIKPGAKAAAETAATTTNSPTSTTTNPANQTRPVQPASGAARTATPANPNAQLQAGLDKVETREEYDEYVRNTLPALRKAS